MLIMPYTFNKIFYLEVITDEDVYSDWKWPAENFMAERNSSCGTLVYVTCPGEQGEEKGV